MRKRRYFQSLQHQRQRLLLGGGLLLAMLASGFTGAWLQAQRDTDSSLIGQKKIVTSESRLISQIVQDVGPSVVSVNVAIASDDPGYGFFGPAAGLEQAAGTGVIISDSGIIMTNRHVVPSGATEVSVTLSDGTELKDVSVIGRTNTHDSLDVAFLKINDRKGHKLQAASIGDSTTVRVGDNVIAIGNALGQFQNTVTSGIISGYGRSVIAGDSSDYAAPTENLANLFQTDAAINQGNSGGPLVNLNGQVIGLNTAVAGNAQNIGFAIPVNDLRGLIKQVLDTGSFQRPYLGVRYVTLSADLVKDYGLSVSQGAFIIPSGDQVSSSVIADGPADVAGLRERDVITAVGDTKIDAAHSLPSALGDYKPGDTVTLTIARDDKTLHISVKLGALPGDN